MDLRLPAPTKDPDPTTLPLAELARQAHDVNPGLPAPKRELTEGELVLSAGENPDGDESGADVDLTEPDA